MYSIKKEEIVRRFCACFLEYNDIAVLGQVRGKQHQGKSKILCKFRITENFPNCQDKIGERSSPV